MKQATDATTAITSISPFFIVSDFSSATAFYRDMLGFEIRLQTPDDEPFFAILGRDGVSLMVKEIAPDVPPQPNPTRHEWARWDAFVHTPDPDALFDEFEKRGLTFHQPLGDTDDGLRGFEVQDVDGYVLFFGR